MTVWPQVKAWIVATAPGLTSFTDAEVYSGIPATESAPMKFLAAGAVMDENNAGTFARELGYDGNVWRETGEVRSMIVANSGDSDGTAAETAAFAMAADLDNAINADRTLGGVLSPDSEVHTSVDVLAISNSNGTATALVHVLTYTTIPD